MMIGDGVTSIGGGSSGIISQTAGAMHWIPYMTTVATPESGIVIKGYQNFNRSGIILPKGMTETSSYSIDRTYQVTKLFLPENFKKIATKTFVYAVGTDGEKCNIADVYSYNATAPTFNSDAFNQASADQITVHVMPGCASAYSGWASNSIVKAVVEDLGLKRSFTAGEWTIVTMPVEAEQPAGIDFFTIKNKVLNKKGEVLKLILEPVDKNQHLEGGVPYIAKAANDQQNLLIKGFYSVIPVTSVNTTGDNGLHGTLASASDLADAVVLVNGKMVEATSCNANEGYIILSEVTIGDDDNAAEAIVIKEDVVEIRDTYQVATSGENKLFFYVEDKEPIEGGIYEATIVAPNIIRMQHQASNAPRRVQGESVNISDYLPKTDEDYIIGDFVCPEQIEIDGVTVKFTAIDPLAFAGQKYMTSVTIPATVKTVNRIGGDSNEFNTDDLLDTDGLAIPELTSVFGYAFPIPNASGIFYDCYALESVEFLGNDITDLGSGVFYGCVNLKSVTLPTGITTIPHGAFVGCYNLGNLDLSSLANAKEIGYYAFMMTGIPAEFKGEELDSDILKDYLPIENITGYIVDLKTKTGKDFDISKLAGLTNVVLPDGIKDIRYGAFQESPYLETVAKKTSGALSGIERMGNWVFAAPYTKKSSLKEIDFTGSTFTSLPYATFAYTTSLESVTLPESLKEIGVKAFYRSAIKNIDLPEGLENISPLAFDYANVEYISFPPFLKRIGAQAFYNSKLKEAASTATVAPALGSSKSDKYSTEGIDYFYTSAYSGTLEPASTTPDAFKTYDNLSRLPIIVPDGSVESYIEKGWNKTFLFVDNILSLIVATPNEGAVDDGNVQFILRVTHKTLVFVDWGDGDMQRYVLTTFDNDEENFPEELVNTLMGRSEAGAEVKVYADAENAKYIVGFNTDADAADFSSIDAGGLTEIVRFLAEGNADMEELDLSNNEAIHTLTIKDCLISDLKVHDNATFIDIDISGNSFFFDDFIPMSQFDETAGGQYIHHSQQDVTIGTLNSDENYMTINVKKYMNVANTSVTWHYASKAQDNGGAAAAPRRVVTKDEELGAKIDDSLITDNGDGTYTFDESLRGTPVKAAFTNSEFEGTKIFSTEVKLGTKTTTGIDDITVEEVDADALYFDLRGVQVTNPASGRVLIKVTPAASSKVLLK